LDFLFFVSTVWENISGTSIPLLSNKKKQHKTERVRLNEMLIIKGLAQRFNCSIQALL